MGGLIIEHYVEGDLVNRDTQTLRQEAGPLYSVNLGPEAARRLSQRRPYVTITSTYYPFITPQWFLIVECELLYWVFSSRHSTRPAGFAMVWSFNRPRPRFERALL
jgi:hypothetical protein